MQDHDDDGRVVRPEGRGHGIIRRLLPSTKPGRTAIYGLIVKRIAEI